jgi:hypothetical protein
MHLREPSARLTALSFCLDYIRSLDKMADQLSSEKILRLKKAVAVANYHITAGEVATKIIDHTQRRRAGSDDTSAFARWN